MNKNKLDQFYTNPKVSDQLVGKLLEMFPNAIALERERERERESSWNLQQVQETSLTHFLNIT